MSLPIETPIPTGVMINGNPTDPPVLKGDPAAGFKLYHHMMRIRDPERSLYFYRNLMGMRTIFTLDAGPFTIFYLGYPQTQEHKDDLDRFSSETLPRLAHTTGLIELFHVHGSEKLSEMSTGNTPPNLGFGHLGFSVPNVQAALEHLQSHGVEIVKPLDRAERADVPLSDWEADRGIGRGDLHGEYQKILKQIGFVKDPVRFPHETIRFLAKQATG